MKGNLAICLKRKTTTKNDYGETITAYIDMCNTTGFLDMLTYDKNKDMNAMIQEANYVFVTDNYINIEETNSNMLKAVINDVEYSVIYIDDPVNLHEFLEIYLKKVGE